MYFSLSCFLFCAILFLVYSLTRSFTWLVTTIRQLQLQYIIQDTLAMPHLRVFKDVTHACRLLQYYTYYYLIHYTCLISIDTSSTCGCEKNQVIYFDVQAIMHYTSQFGIATSPFSMAMAASPIFDNIILAYHALGYRVERALQTQLGDAARLGAHRADCSNLLSDINLVCLNLSYWLFFLIFRLQFK
jgi:hypothetical protein